jgi:hypothetical protein
MKQLLTIVLFTIIVAACVSPPFAHAADRQIAVITLKSSLKLDPQARKEIAAAAATIRKVRNGGTVKLKGVYSGASSSDEYLTKSVFMSREVEQYLKTLLPKDQQVYSVTSAYPGEGKNGPQRVEIILYPHELEPAEIEVVAVANPGPVESPTNRATSAPSGIVSGSNVTTTGELSRSRTKEPSEDVELANDLVRKAKEKAARRARRNQDAE